jgi:glycerol-3-phosphate cytidylyltransferase
MQQYSKGGSSMKKVITYGTFDLLHWGHINLLKRAKDLGDHLTVAISSDEFNDLKNKQAYHSFDNRKMILESIRYVDKVIPENDWEQKIKDVIENDIDIFVMGDDWKGKFDFLKDYCEVVYLPRTVGISTSKIKNDLFKVNNG